MFQNKLAILSLLLTNSFFHFMSKDCKSIRRLFFKHLWQPIELISFQIKKFMERRSFLDQLQLRSLRFYQSYLMSTVLELDASLNSKDLKEPKRLIQMLRLQEGLHVLLNQLETICQSLIMKLIMYQVHQRERLVNSMYYQQSSQTTLGESDATLDQV